jgi:hypothetical protein
MRVRIRTERSSQRHRDRLRRQIGRPRGAPTKVAAFGGVDDYELFPLDGVDLAFDPPPTGATIDLSNLPHIGDVVGGHCATFTEPRADLTSAAPTGLAARIAIPGGPLQSRVTPLDNRLTLLTVADDVRIVGTSFGGGSRELKVTDATLGDIIIANVDFDDPTPDDLRDRSLYCALMQAPQPLHELAEQPAEGTAKISALVKRASASSGKRRTKRRGVIDGPRPSKKHLHQAPPFTLGPGCSNSQIP